MLTTEEAEYMLDYLDQMFPMLAFESKLGTDDLVVEQIMDHAKKSSGYPWNQLGAPSKGQALEKFGFNALRDHYAVYTSVVGSTLKDELRLFGKDARLFRPQDVSSYAEGTRLFYWQNQYMMSLLFDTPMFNCFIVPGQHIPSAFRVLESFAPHNCYAADGSQWDANFPLSIASVIATFRSKGQLDPESISRYYSMMYNGYTAVGGNIVEMTGNPSGHFNTSVDNSLCNMCLMALHAFRSGLTVEHFVDQVKFFCCGDDIIWADRSGLFSPVLLSHTCVSVGVFQEYESLHPQCAFDLHFVGMHCIQREIAGCNVVLASLRPERTRASALLRKRRMTDRDELGKLCSLAQLVFADIELFDMFQRVIYSFVSRCVSKHTMDVGDPIVQGQLRSITERSLIAAHLAWECIFNPHAVKGDLKSQAF